MNKIECGSLSAANEGKSSRETVFITELAIPPSSNHQYSLMMINGKMRHIPSKELKNFQASVDEYPFRFPHHFADCKKKIQEWISQKKVLEVHCTFFMKESRLYTVKQEPKKIDVSNRLKSCHDSVAKILGIDDKLFFRIFAEKCIAHPRLGEMTCVEIMPYR